MSQVLSITENAAKQIKKIIHDAPSEVTGILIGVEKGGCSGYSYKLEFLKENNIEDFDVINEFGVKIYIDPKATMYLLGSVMDYTTDKLSSRFIFNNPNEKNTCGCGESFSI